MRVAIILGTSRPTGNTAQLINYFVAKTRCQASVCSLSDYHVLPYDYQFVNQDDDFPELISEVITKHELIVLATPIYWYAPSAQMKVFMDRLTDLLEINKTQGRQLKGKYVGVIATGVASEVPACFEQIFRLTFDYLHMKYIGLLYCAFPADNVLSHTMNEALAKAVDSSPLTAFVDGIADALDNGMPLGIAKAR